MFIESMAQERNSYHEYFKNLLFDFIIAGHAYGYGLQKKWYCNTG